MTEAGPPADWGPPAVPPVPPPPPGPPPPVGGPAGAAPTVDLGTGPLAGGQPAWQRPHPYTLLIEFVSSLRDLIIPILFLSTQGGDLFELFPLLAVVLPFGAAAARYYSTRYALTDEALLHEYGVIRRNKQVLPRRNIQNLSTSAGLIARATGLVELTASDASQGGDVKLKLLSVEAAEGLMTLLRADAAAASRAIAQPAPGPGAAPPPSLAAQPFAAEPMYATAIDDLVRFTVVTSGGPIVAGILSIVAIVVVVAMPEVLAELSLGSAIFVLGPVGAVVVPALAPIFAFGGFRLWSDPDRLRIKTGLLTEIQVSARRERMQLVQVDRHVFARRLGLEAIRFETADVETGSSRVNHLAPAVAFDSWPRFASDALGEVELGEADLHRVSPLTRRRSLIRLTAAAVPLVGALTAAIVLAPGANRLVLTGFSAVILIGYGLIAVWYASRRAARLGWALGTDQFLFRTGVIAEKLYLVRKEKLQTLRLHQSFFQRRLGLANITLGTAGLGALGLVSLPDLEVPVAEELLAHLADASASTPLERTL